MPAHKRLIGLGALTAIVVIAWTADGLAQPHGRGVDHAPVRGAVVVAPYYYAPLWAYDPWFYDAPWGGPYSYQYYGDPGGSVKLEVKPRNAQVYVDGYYAGIVDDFDGAFQRLRIIPGEHEIVLYLEGYRTVRQKVYVQPNNTFKMKQNMEKLGSGEHMEPRPTPPAPPPSAEPGGQPGQPPYGQVPPPPYGRRAPQGTPPPNAPQPPSATYGMLAIRVQPGPADVVVDGEKWRGPEGQERIFIELPEGRHTIEIQKPGYRTYVTDVEIHRGDTTQLNVSLRTQN